MTTFTFDVKLLATFHVKADCEGDARLRLADHLRGADANFGAWETGPDAGDPILASASMDGEADLIEVDGEDADAAR